MNRTLLWKDFLLLKDTMVAGLALLSFSYFMAGILVYMDSHDGFAWSKMIAGGASLARFTTVLICALVGGHVYGREREDRSREFLDQLPASRRDVARSKTIVSTAALTLFWALSMAILVLGLVFMGFGLDTILRVLLAMLGFFASGVAVFGSALLASSFVSSSVGASFAGLMVLAPLLAIQAGLNWVFSLDNRFFFHWSMIVFMLFVGTGCTVLSARLYIHEIDLAGNGTSRLPGLWRRGPRRVATELAELKMQGTRSALGAILWKDYQLIRAPLLLGLIVLVIPYAIGVAGIGLLQHPREYFRGASLICTGLGVVIVSFWAGQITSMEYSTKTIAFTSYLPIPRRLALASKLLLTLCPTVAIVAANAICLLLANTTIPGTLAFGVHFTWSDWNQNGFIVMGFALANGTLVAYSLAWLLGAHYRRPALAIVSGIIVVPFCVMVWASISSAMSMADHGISPLRFVALFSVGAALVSLAGIVAGAALDYRSFQD